MVWDILISYGGHLTVIVLYRSASVETIVIVAVLKTHFVVSEFIHCEWELTNIVDFY